MGLFTSQEELFRSLMDYFAARPVKILSCSKPSYIRVEIGSFFSQHWPSYMRVETKLEETDAGNHLHFNFDTSKEHIAGSVFAFLVSLLSYGVLSWVLSSIILELSYWTIMTLPILAAVFVFFIIIALENYNVSVTKKRFIGELSKFAQSKSTHLSSPKN